MSATAIAYEADTARAPAGSPPGSDVASQALGHADPNTTLGIYGHRDQTDLEVALDAYARWLEQQREDEIVPPETGL